MGIDLEKCKITNDTPNDIFMIDSLTGKSIQIRGGGGHISPEHIKFDTIIITAPTKQKRTTEKSGAFSKTDCSFIQHKDGHVLFKSNPLDTGIIFDKVTD